MFRISIPKGIKIYPLFLHLSLYLFCPKTNNYLLLCEVRQDLLNGVSASILTLFFFFLNCTATFIVSAWKNIPFLNFTQQSKLKISLICTPHSSKNELRNKMYQVVSIPRLKSPMTAYIQKQNPFTLPRSPSSS